VAATGLRTAAALWSGSMLPCDVEKLPAWRGWTLLPEFSLLSRQEMSAVAVAMFARLRSWCINFFMFRRIDPKFNFLL